MSNDPRLQALGDTPGSDVCGCTRAMMQGPQPGEYRGLTLDEQKRMNAMYRELNEWNARALRLIAEREVEAQRIARRPGAGQ